MVRLAVNNTDAITTGYSTSFITSSNSKTNTLTFEFTDKLFQNNSAKIQKDSLGNEYIIVSVSADKIGTSIVDEVVGISTGNKKKVEE